MTTQVRIAAIRDVGPEAIALDLETPPEFEAEPGQFVKLSATVDGQTESRFYSISSPYVDETFEVTIEVDPDGTLAPWLADRAAGERLSIAGPFGHTYYAGEDRSVVLAGGPGVGPAVGIAERAIAEGNKAAIVYRDETPIHRDRLTAIEERGGFVRVLDAEHPLETAVEDALSEGGQVFVYGFADFLDVAMDAIDAAGGDADGAKVENFG